MVVGSPRHQPEPLGGERGGEGPGVGDDLGRVVAERRQRRLPEGHRLGRDDVLERAALEPGEDGGVDRLGEGPGRTGWPRLEGPAASCGW